MPFVQLVLGQWIRAAQAKIKFGLGRAIMGVLAAGLFLMAIGFGFAGAIIALAAKVGVVWALAIACVMFLAMAFVIALFARTAQPLATAPMANAPFAQPMAASEMAFLVGFIAMRSLLRQSRKPPR